MIIISLKKIIQENPEYRKVDYIKNTKTNVDNLHIIGIVNEIRNTKKCFFFLEKI